MQQLNIGVISRDLATCARHYIEEAMRDRLGGIIGTAFNQGLSRRGMSDVIELHANPASVLLQQDPKRPTQLTFDYGKFIMSRIITPEFEGDIDDIQVNPSQFISRVEDAINDYVNTLATDTTHASIPALYVKVDAFRVKWMLWGYVGRPNPNAKA